MFILSFTIFTLIFTIFENLYLALFAFIFIFIISSIVLIFQKSKFSSKIKSLGLIILAFILSFSATTLKQINYFSQLPQRTQTDYQRLIMQAKPEPQNQFYIGSGLVVDTHSKWRYIFQDGQKRKFFLYSEKKYKIWDQIRLTAYVSPWLTWINLLYNTKIESDFFQNITSWKDMSGFLNYEFDYPKRLMMKWMYGSLYEKQSILLKSTKLTLIQKTRKNLQNLVVDAYWENRISGLVLWMLIWDRSQLPKTDYQTFIDSGLVHIIAVSGWNIVMIVVFLSFVLVRIPFYPRNWIILVFVVFYAFMCWLDSSVFRAMLMWWMSLLALFRWREVNIRRSLSITFVAMLLINPYFLIYDIGFLFSFSAILWLIFIDTRQKKIRERKKEESQSQPPRPESKTKIFLKKHSNNFLSAYIRPTIWATLGVLPVMSFFIWKINLLGLFANALVLPVVAFVMIYGFVSVVLYQIIPRDIFLRIEEILVKYIFRISEFTAKYGVYLIVESAQIKRLFLILAIFIFIRRRLKLLKKSYL